MKVLISLSYYYPNISGVSIYAKNLAEELAKKDHEVTILTSQHSKNLPLKETINGVEIIRVPITFQIGKGALMFLLPFIAFRYIKNTDIVNCHLPQFESFLIVFLAKFFRKKVILTHHTDLSGWKGIINRISESLVFVSQLIAGYLTDSIITYTKDYADYSSYLKHFTHKTIYAYPLMKIFPVDKHYREVLKKKIGDLPILIGFSGRIAKQKGLEVLFNAVPFLEQKLKKFKIVFAGPYKEVIGENHVHDLKDEIKKYNDKIVFLGLVPNEKMSSFYSLLNCLVLPSDDRLESFGFVQVEAMLSGIPVVASNLPGVRIPIKKTGMGELVSVKDSKALAYAIIKILKNRKKYLKPKKDILKIFNFNDTIAQYEKLFTK